MKKAFVLLAAALSAGVLAGCNSAPKDWKEEEKKLMTDNLGGNVLPYYYVEGYVVTDEYLEDYGCISVEALQGKKEDVLAYEKLLVAKEYTCDVKVGDDLDMPYFGSYYKTFADDFVLMVQVYVGGGTKETGKFCIDAYYAQEMQDYSEYDLDSWTKCAASTKSYFEAYNSVAPVLPETLETSATTFDMMDYRYMYYAYYGEDVGFPVGLLYLNGAKEAELDGVIAAFVAKGYAKKTTSEGEEYYEYGSKQFFAEFEYEPAEEDFPEAISILIY